MAMDGNIDTNISLDQTMIERESVNPNDGLIAGVFPVTDIVSVYIAKSTGAAVKYPRGTVLDLSGGTGGNGSYKPHGATPGASETLTPSMILARDVTVGTDDNAVAFAYRTGNFNRSHLICTAGKQLTAADVEALRNVGILVSDDHQ